jgi:hypothetical protein
VGAQAQALELGKSIIRQETAKRAPRANEELMFDDSACAESMNKLDSNRRFATATTVEMGHVHSQLTLGTPAELCFLF